MFLDDVLNIVKFAIKILPLVGNVEIDPAVHFG